MCLFVNLVTLFCVGAAVMRVVSKAGAGLFVIVSLFSENVCDEACLIAVLAPRYQLLCTFHTSALFGTCLTATSTTLSVNKLRN